MCIYAYIRMLYMCACVCVCHLVLRHMQRDYCITGDVHDVVITVMLFECAS